MFDLSCGIRLRAFKPTPAEDLEYILSIYNNSQVAPLITERYLVPRGEKLKDEFKEIIDKNSEMFCIIETIPQTADVVDGDATRTDASSRTKPQFIGFTALWGHMERGNRHSSYSIILLPEFWSRGCGTEITKFMIDHAFLHLNMHRISLEVYEGNDRAISVYKKLGFIEEGRQRQVNWVNGGWKSIVYMGILAEEWTQMRKAVNR